MSDGEPIPLARAELGAREEELALEVLRSGRLSLGPMLERFERDFAAWLGVDDAVGVSSGTTALHLGAPESGSAPDAPRWSRLRSAVKPSLTMSWLATPVSVATKATPHASCSWRPS